MYNMYNMSKSFDAVRFFSRWTISQPTDTEVFKIPSNTSVLFARMHYYVSVTAVKTRKRPPDEYYLVSSVSVLRTALEGKGQLLSCA